MKYLLDTVVFLYFLKGTPEHFSEAAKRVLSNPDHRYLVSVVSLWEIAIKYSLEKLALEKKPGAWMTDIVSEMGWELLPLLAEHTFRVADLPYHHRDPFDRLLVVQAQTEKIPLITPDDKIRKYDVKCVW